MQISDKVFLITGAASGLGEATARMFVARGAKVVLADVNAAGASLATELGDSARFIRTDVTSEADGEAAVAAAREHFGALHGLVNCAGIAPSEKIAGRNGPHSLEIFTRAIMINLVGTFNMLRVAAGAMLLNEPLADGERGVIINTASIAAFEGQIGQAAYAASKARSRRPYSPRCKRACAQRHPSRHDRSGSLHDAHDGRLPSSGAGITRTGCTFPRAPRSA